MFTSIYCLTAFSVDRYVAVVHPIKAARYRRPTVAKVVNLGVWVLSLLVILPIVASLRTAANSDGTVACNMPCPSPPSAGWWASCCTLSSWASCCPSGPSACATRAHHRQNAHGGPQAGWQQRKRSERKITLMVMMVVMVFVICWMPFYVVQLVNVFAEQDDATVSQRCRSSSATPTAAPTPSSGLPFRQLQRSFQRILWPELDGQRRRGAGRLLRHGPQAALTAWRTSSPRTWESGGVFRNGTRTSRITTL